MPRPPAITRRLARLLAGPLPALPRWLDRIADWWSGRPPRVRATLLTLVIVALLGSTEARVRAVEARWGGAPVAVLVATRDLGVGDEPTDLRRRSLPPAAVPPGALRATPPGVTALSLALPEGAVLTAAHLDPRGPAAGLSDDLRAVPVPIESGWGVVGGGWVDLWLLADGGAASQLAARSRPVLEVREDHQPTALVGLTPDEVEVVTEGLAAARLLLTHAPPP
jgi:Flp pilus assembly protein CpaB